MAGSGRLVMASRRHLLWSAWCTLLEDNEENHLFPIMHVLLKCASRLSGHQNLAYSGYVPSCIESRFVELLNTPSWSVPVIAITDLNVGRGFIKPVHVDLLNFIS